MKPTSEELDDKIYKLALNPEKNLSISEIEQFIFELRNDCRDLYNKEFLKIADGEPTKTNYQNMGFYDGEANAFQIALNLLEHLAKNPS
jgi:hypothetical protein